MLVYELKSHLRRTERDRWLRGTAEEQLLARSIAAQDNLLSAFPPGPGKKVALYSAMDTEVRTDRIRSRCLAVGAVPFYPRVMEDGGLAFFPDAGDAAWVRGRYGLLEPAVPAGEEGLRRGFDLVVVPGMAFDASGRRLGKGFGYYDRFLAGLDPATITVGLAFSWQMVPEVPVEPWDVPVLAVATEEGVLRTAARLRGRVK